MTWERMRFSVSSLVPAAAVCEPVLTQNSVDLPPVLAALRGLRTLAGALRSVPVVVRAVAGGLGARGVVAGAGAGVELAEAIEELAGRSVGETVGT